MAKSRTHDYYRRRASEEHAAAAQAVDERAAQCHRDLAQRYESMADGMTDAGPIAHDRPSPGAAILSNDFRIVP